MLLALRKRLAEWLYQIDVIELTKRQLSLVQLKDVKIYEEMEIEEQDRLAANALSLFKNPAFLTVIQYLTRRQEEMTSREAPAWDSVLIGRGTINGFDLVFTEFQQLAQAQEAKLTTEKFNKHDIT